MRESLLVQRPVYQQAYPSAFVPLNTYGPRSRNTGEPRLMARLYTALIHSRSRKASFTQVLHEAVGEGDARVRAGLHRLHRHRDALAVEHDDRRVLARARNLGVDRERNQCLPDPFLSESYSNPSKNAINKENRR